MTNKEHIKKLNKQIEKIKFEKKIGEFIIHILLILLTEYMIVEILAGIVSKL